MSDQPEAPFDPNEETPMTSRHVVFASPDDNDFACLLGRPDPLGMDWEDMVAMAVIEVAPGIDPHGFNPGPIVRGEEQREGVTVLWSDYGKTDPELALQRETAPWAALGLMIAERHGAGLPELWQTLVRHKDLWEAIDRREQEAQEGEEDDKPPF